MDITLFSVITSILLCNVFIMIIALVSKRNNFIIHFSIAPLLLLIVAGFFRLIWVIEFPNTIIIHSQSILPSIFMFFRQQLFAISHGTVSLRIIDLLIIIWISGSIFSLLKYIYQSVNLHKLINEIPSTTDKRISTAMDKVLKETGKITNVKIIQIEQIKIPMIVGFFNPVICLPHLEFTDEELNNILLHEWSHFLHRHIWVKLTINIISLIFWWNPFVHYLKRELNHILEIQCDLSIVSNFNEERRLSYLESIMRIIRESNKNTLQYTVPANCAALVSSNKSNKIEQRFKLVLNYDTNKKKSIFQVIVICIIILLTLLASYKIVFQPVFAAPEEEDGYEVYSITPENAYLIKNENGSYSLYADDIFRVELTDISMEPFSSLPIK